MTQPDTIHTRLRDEINRRLAVARAATPGPWRPYGDHVFEVYTDAFVHDPDYEPPAVTHGSDRKTDAEHIALHDPADATRRYEGELQTLERHWRNGAACEACWRVTSEVTEGVPWPCAEILSLAHRLGVSVDA